MEMGFDSALGLKIATYDFSSGSFPPLWLGPLPPSRRRSVFTLAISMIVFSSRAFDILPLVPIVKSSFNANMVDPFLCLVEDSKLRAMEPASGHLSKIYRSKEDDNAALKSLSAISLTDDQSKDSIISLIINSLGDLSDSEFSTINAQLLNDFLPDDACPLGAQFVETPGQIPTFVPKKDYLSEDQIMPKTFAVEDDVNESFENPSDTRPQLPIDTNVLSVNQLLESVLETAIGRLSVCTTPDIPFKEMASHCEALVMGKQQKMSVLMSAQQKQDIGLSDLPQDHSDVMQSTNLCPDQIQMVENPFLSQNLNAYPPQMSSGPALPCATEIKYQFPQPEFLRLPASSPYDNFLKAAGC